MNIDLRNISNEFEKQVNKIKREFDINTNSKAVEHCVVNYFDKLGEIERLKNALHHKTEELNDIKKDVKSLTGSLSRLNKIT